MTRKSTRTIPRGDDDPSASPAALPHRSNPLAEPADPRRRQPQDGAAPRAGRTGGLGARAERPSEGSKQPVETTRQEQGGRGGKAPSAAASQAGWPITPAGKR